MLFKDNHYWDMSKSLRRLDRAFEDLRMKRRDCNRWNRGAGDGAQDPQCRPHSVLTEGSQEANGEVRKISRILTPVRSVSVLGQWR